MRDRYELPDPKCNHVRRGIVRAGDPHGAYAATNVCDRAECIEDAKAWAEATVREPAEHVPDHRPSADSLATKASQDSFWAEHPEVQS